MSRPESRRERHEGQDCRSAGVHVTHMTHDRLTQLVRSNQGHPVAPLLAKKLAATISCPAEEIGPDTVTLNSRVRYRLGAGSDAETRILVHPKDYLPSGQYVSVMCPLGVALLGLATGDEATYAQWNGIVRTVSVVSVENQPERRLYQNI